jgi:hypothetical protein
LAILQTPLGVYDPCEGHLYGWPRLAFEGGRSIPAAGEKPMCPSRRCLYAVVVLLTAFITACHHINPPKAFVPPPPSPISSDSGVAARVSVNLQSVSDTLMKSLPTNLDSSTEKANVPANITVMVPAEITVDVVTFVPQQVNKLVPKSVASTCKKAGILKWIFFPCQVTQMVQVTETIMNRVVTPTVQKIDKATAVKSPLNVDLTHNVYLDRISLTAEGNQLVARAQISYDIAVKADAAIVKVGLTSCGVGEAKPEITITEPMHVHWSVDGKLAIDKEPSTLDWTRPCNLTFADIDLKTVLRITGIQHKLDDQIESALSKIPPQMDLNTALDSLWSSLETPRPLAKDVWLSVKPAGATISDPSGEAQTLAFSAQLFVHPLVTYGVKPVPEHETRPPFEHTEAPEAFSIELEGTADFKDVEKALNSAFAGKDQELSGHTVRVTDFNVFASGSNVVIGVGIQKPFHARLFLFGMPTFNKDSNIFTFTGLDYTLETKNFLLKVADWVLHSTFQDDIRAKAQFPASSYLAEAKAKLNNYQDTIGHVSFSVQAHDVSVENTFLTETGIHVRTQIKGKASALVQ